MVREVNVSTDRLHKEFKMSSLRFKGFCNFSEFLQLKGIIDYDKVVRAFSSNRDNVRVRRRM